MRDRRGDVTCPTCGAQPTWPCSGTGQIVRGGLPGPAWHEARWELYEATRALVSIADAAESQGLLRRVTTWRCHTPGCFKAREVLTQGPSLSYVEAFANNPQVCECGTAMVKST